MRFVRTSLIAVCIVTASGASGGLRLVAGQAAEAGQGTTAPTVVKQVQPDYTPAAKAARIEGSVLLNCVVLANGHVGEVKVERPLDPDFGLDKQAVDAMKQWEFKPGTKDGKPVDVRVQVEMTFRLK
jgi:TonB family protein